MMMTTGMTNVRTITAHQSAHTGWVSIVDERGNAMNVFMPYVVAQAVAETYAATLSDALAESAAMEAAE